jgi:hypothetical protein
MLWKVKPSCSAWFNIWPVDVPLEAAKSEFSIFEPKKLKF